MLSKLAHPEAAAETSNISQSEFSQAGLPPAVPRRSERSSQACVLCTIGGAQEMRPLRKPAKTQGCLHEVPAQLL